MDIDDNYVSLLVSKRVMILNQFIIQFQVTVNVSF